MRKTWFWWLASAGLGGVGAADAATLLEHNIRVQIELPARALEKHHLRIRIETAADVERYANYPIAVDDHRLLRSLAAHALYPEGDRREVKRKQQDTVTLPDASTFHASERYEVLEFAGLRVGAELIIDYLLATAPYYPASWLLLQADEPITALDVEIVGGGPQFRHLLTGKSAGLELTAQPGGLRLRGSNLVTIEPPEGAPRQGHFSALRFAWGEDPTWQGLGRWYHQLLADLPQNDPSVSAQARALLKDHEAPRQRLEALVAFLRQQIRYVAVEVGIGGYRPHPPATVLARRWGDCKDKALLLIELLREAGIAAYPALILAEDDRIDPQFPSPDQFNHLIVAVPTAGLLTTAEDPVADGYLFVDPTQTRGAVRWLHPMDQDQDALVIQPSGAMLVRTPMRPQFEHRRWFVNLSVSAAGHAAGGAALELRGVRAQRFIDQVESAPPERTEEDLRAIFAHLLPGVDLGKTGWTVAPDPTLPALEMVASVQLGGWVQGLDSATPSLRLAGLRLTPEPRLLREREEPIVLTASSADMIWQINLPQDFCLGKASVVEVDNPVGTFRQQITPDPEHHRLRVERHLALKQRYIEPASFPALRELAVAEHQAEQRRVRLECSEG